MKRMDGIHHLLATAELLLANLTLTKLKNMNSKLLLLIQTVMSILLFRFITFEINFCSYFLYEFNGIV